jgi:hypothetical protein
VSKGARFKTIATYHPADDDHFASSSLFRAPCLISKQQSSQQHAIMAEKAGAFDETVENGSGSMVKPTKGQKVKSHFKKWWWLYLIGFIIVVLVVVLPMFVEADFHLVPSQFTDESVAYTLATLTSLATVSRLRSWCQQRSHSSTPHRKASILSWTLC